MFERMATRLTAYLIREGIVLEDEREVLVYGIDGLLASGAQILCLFLAALVTGWWGYILLFSLSFTIPKRWGGGFHLHSHLTCISAFTATATVLSGLSVLISGYPVIFWVVLLLAVLLYFGKAPLMDPNNPKTPEEMNKAKRICRVCAILESVILMTLHFITPTLALAGSLGFLVAALSLLFSNRKEENA